MSGLIAFVWLCTALLTPSSGPSTAPTTRPVARLSPDDVEIINLSLLDLREHADDPFTLAPAKPIVVHALVGPRYVWGHEHARLRGPDDQVVTVPADLVDAWNRRCADAAGSELRAAALTDPRFVLRDLSNGTARHTRSARAFEEKFGAAGYVMLWLPAYRADGREALVHLTFGPTPHGASATFMLKKVDGRWVVTLRDIAYAL